MTSPNLERLAHAGELKRERITRGEFESLVRTARALLADAGREELSQESRFRLVYGASYALASAALRLHGYRSESRYLVFQCLEHTTTLDRSQARLFSLCHDRRNKAEYTGDFEIEETLMEGFLRAAQELLGVVSGMAPES
ncbi:MAG TPA: hypothetical protein VLY46_10465 [Usitatibacter sp.]|nr:hypothetical protein [Usitatibacter sp.]